MNEPDANIQKDCDFESGYVCYHPAGKVSLEEAAELCKRAILFARENGVARLLVDATGLGFPSPTLAERYFISRAFALEARGVVTVALALRPEILDPERFGVKVATNLDMKITAVATRTEALQWLQEQGATATSRTIHS